MLRLFKFLVIFLIFSWLSGCQSQIPIKFLKNLEYNSYASETGESKLLLDLYLPQIQSSQPLPVLIYIHGGGWLENSKESCPGKIVAQRGYAVACINYRYSNQALFPAQIHDVKNAVRWLRSQADRYNLDSNKFGAWGDSAGGYLSALLGTSAGVGALEGETNYPNISSKIQAVGNWYGPTDFTKFPPAFDEYPTPEVLAKNKGKPWLRYTEVTYKLLGGTISQKLELAKLANPITYLDANDPPFLIIHGELDTIVPISQSDLLAKALKSKGVEFQYARLANLKHSYRGKNGESFDPDLINITIAFFDQYLK